MTTLVRQLSFGRRRKKGGVTHPQCDEVKRGAASQKEQTPTEGDSEETLSEGDGRVGAPWVLVPLCSSLKKKHHNATVFSSPAQRWFEVDDLLGVMYQFKDRSSMERRSACLPPLHGRPRARQPSSPCHLTRTAHAVTQLSPRARAPRTVH